MRGGVAMVGCALATCHAVARAPYLMVADTLQDRVVLFSRSDGSMLDGSFITDTGLPIDIRSPRAALQVDGEIWITDQVGDAVWVFSAARTPVYLRTVAAGLDNVRGLARVGDRVYVAYAGDTATAADDGIAALDLEGSPLFSFPTGGSPHDIAHLADTLLVSNADGRSIDRFGLAGEYMGRFVESRANVAFPSLPQQILVTPDAVLVAGLLAPSGIFSYTPEGAPAGLIPLPNGVRGVAALDDGRLLFTQGSVASAGAGGVYTYDPLTGAAARVVEGDFFQYIHPLDLPAPPEPCNLADVVAIGGFPPPDGGLTVDDYTSFINAFAGDSLLADVASIGGFPPPDGELTVDDYTSFINAFAEGCR